MSVMDLRAWLVIAAVAVAAMASAVQSSKDREAAVHVGTKFSVFGHGLPMDLDEDELLMESESARRQLRKGQYLSYEALARNNIPCGQRGNTYYDCRGHERANPYNRGCTRATLCKRNTR